MLKRAVYLFLLSVALLLLLSLMVVSAESEPPRLDVAVPAQAVLLPPDAVSGAKPLSHREAQPAARDVSYDASLQRTTPAQPVADANGVPVAAGTYCLSAYFAFCLTCSAG